MKNIQPLSVLEQCIQKVYASKTVDEGKDHMIAVLDQVKIKPTDKQKMIHEIKNITQLSRLQFYATNAMFKFEGLGVNGRTIVKK